MNTEINGESHNRTSTIDDLASSHTPAAPMAPDRSVFAVNTDGVVKTPSEKTLDPLFEQEAATDFRSRWDVVQRGFVDDPQEAVRAADELVAQVIKSLAETFSSQRSALEGELHQTEQASTENLRLGLRRYRSFFERLLAIEGAER
jgi:hypothetical protein